eukprot:6175459-Pleurochrysis_carterae.AAC.3
MSRSFHESMQSAAAAGNTATLSARKGPLKYYLGGALRTDRHEDPLALISVVSVLTSLLSAASLRPRPAARASSATVEDARANCCSAV